MLWFSFIDPVSRILWFTWGFGKREKKYYLLETEEEGNRRRVEGRTARWRCWWSFASWYSVFFAFCVGSVYFFISFFSLLRFLYALMIELLMLVCYVECFSSGCLDACLVCCMILNLLTQWWTLGSEGLNAGLWVASFEKLLYVLNLYAYEICAQWWCFLRALMGGLECFVWKVWNAQVFVAAGVFLVYAVGFCNW